MPLYSFIDLLEAIKMFFHPIGYNEFFANGVQLKIIRSNF